MWYDWEGRSEILLFALFAITIKNKDLKKKKKNKDLNRDSYPFHMKLTALLLTFTKWKISKSFLI